MTVTSLSAAAERLLAKMQAGAASETADAADTAPPDPTPDELFENVLHRLHVPRKYLGVRRSTLLHPAIADWRGTPWCVTLLGKAGRGKTWQAVRLLAEVFMADERRFVWSKHRPMFVDWSTAIEQIKREFDGADRGVTFDRLCNAELLLLDDFGAERETAFSLDQGSLILRARYNDQRPTILTTNLPSLDPIAASEPRIASRLSEGILLPIDGRDRRLPRPEERR